MKPRRIVITLEITTSVPLANLRFAANWGYAMRYVFDDDAEVHQAQVNVVKVSDGKTP